MLVLMSSSAPTRARSAGFLAAAAGASGVGLSALAGMVYREDRRAPGAFIVCLAIVGVALVLHLTR